MSEFSRTFSNAGPGLVIGIPTLGRPVPLSWAFSFKSMTTPINYNVMFQTICGKPVADARNEIASFAVEKDAKYLFFLGDDVVCPNHTLKQLIHRLENRPDIDVVGGVYCSKCVPSAPLVFRGNGRGSYWNWKIGEFFEVTGLGMDCTLIRVETLKKLSQPWFKTVESDQFLDGVNAGESWTEDLFFFNKLQEELAESKVFCDGMVICEHHDVYKNCFFGLPQGSLPRREKAKHTLLQLLIVNPIEGEIIQDLVTHDLTTFGSSEDCDYRGDLSSLPFGTAEFDKLIIFGDGNSPELARVLKPDGVFERRNS